MHAIRIMPGSWRNKFHTEIQNSLFYSLIGIVLCILLFDRRLHRGLILNVHLGQQINEFHL